MMDRPDSTPKSRRPFFVKLKDSFQNAKDFTKLCKEMDAQAQAEIAEIQRDTELYKQKMAEHTAGQLKQMDLISEKLKLGLEDKDPAFVQSQIDAMLSLLDEKPDIQQQVDDSKLKPAK